MYYKPSNVGFGCPAGGLLALTEIVPDANAAAGEGDGGGIEALVLVYASL